MHTDAAASPAGDRRGVLRGAGVMAAGGLVFLVPVVSFPGIHANFEEDPATRLAGLEAHWTNFWIGSALFSVGWLLMGLALFLLCRSLADLEVGRSASALRLTGSVLLVPFLLLAAAYIHLLPMGWGLSPAEYAARTDEPQAMWLTIGQVATAATILVGWLTVSSILARSRHWPTWLGVVFGLMGVLTVITQLPLFAAIGAVVLGWTVWRRADRQDLGTALPA